MDEEINIPLSSGNIDYIVHNMVDNLSTWKIVLKNRSLWKDKKIFLPFISNFPTESISENISELYGMQFEYGLLRLIKYSRTLGISLLKSLNKLWIPMIPVSSIITLEFPVSLDLLFRVTKFRSFSDVKIFFDFIQKKGISPEGHIINYYRMHGPGVINAYVSIMLAQYYPKKRLIHQNSEFDSLIWKIILEEKYNNVLERKLKRYVSHDFVYSVIVDMAIITGKLEVLEHVIRHICPINTLNFMDVYAKNFSQIYHITEKSPGQELWITKKFIRSVRGEQLVDFPYKVPFVVINSMTNSDLFLFRPYMQFSKPGLLTAVRHFDPWNFISFLVYYQNFDIDKIFLSYIEAWDYRCTDLVQDLGADPNGKKLTKNIEKISSNKFLIRMLISNGLHLYDEMQAKKESFLRSIPIEI